MTVTLGRVAGVDVAHLARHGAGHAGLSRQIEHSSNLAALLAMSVDCLLSLTVCGTVDPSVPPGSLVVFDDLYFPSNRLPDGGPCTWHTSPAPPGAATGSSTARSPSRCAGPWSTPAGVWSTAAVTGTSTGRGSTHAPGY